MTKIGPKREKAPFEGAKFNILGWLPLIWGTTDVFAKFQLVLTSKSEFMIFLGKKYDIWGSANGVFRVRLAHFLEKYLKFLNETKTMKCARKNYTKKA